MMRFEANAARSLVDGLLSSKHTAPLHFYLFVDMATSLPGMSSSSEALLNWNARLLDVSPRSHVLDKHLESELTSKKKKRKIICGIFLRIVLQIDGEMS